MDDKSDEQYELESELDDVEAQLDVLYSEAEALKPYVDDRVWSETLFYQQRRTVLRQRLGL